MNIKLHYLELFYHVTRHGGQSAAARNIGYSLQPSSISRQICDLERTIGFPLYIRDPFKLTPAGEQLYDFIKPLFDELPRLVQRLGQGVPELVRLGGSSIALREYLPSLLPGIRKNFPQLRLTFNEGTQTQVNTWLKDNLIDLAVTLVSGKLPKGYSSEVLLHLPLVLLVPKNSRLRSASDIWRRKPIKETLISSGPEDAIHEIFSEGLQKRGVEWPVELDTGALVMVERMVKQGLGIGLSVAMPGRSIATGLRVLELPGFPRVPVGMIWRDNPSPAAEALMREARRQVSGWGARDARGDGRWKTGDGAVHRASAT